MWIRTFLTLLWASLLSGSAGAQSFNWLRDNGTFGPLSGGVVSFVAPPASSGTAYGLLDSTAVIASQSAFWTGFGVGGATPGNPVVHKFNRMLVGEFSTKSTGCHTGAQSWLHTFFGSDCESANIAVTSTLGTTAITAAARTSDFRTWKSAASQGTSSAFFFGINDDTGAGGPIMDTINVEAVAAPGVNGATLGAQFNVDNLAHNLVCDPYIFCDTMVLLLTPGITPPLSPNFNVASALVVGGSGFAGTFHNSGIVISQDAIAPGAGPTVNGAASSVGMAMPSTNAVVWYTSGNTASGAIYSGTAQKMTLWARNNINLQANDGVGSIDINPGGNGGLIINGTPAVSCPAGTVNVGTFVVTNGIVTHC